MRTLVHNLKIRILAMAFVALASHLLAAQSPPATSSRGPASAKRATKLRAVSPNRPSTAEDEPSASLLIPGDISNILPEDIVPDAPLDIRPPIQAKPAPKALPPLPPERPVIDDTGQIAPVPPADIPTPPEPLVRRQHGDSIPIEPDPRQTEAGCPFADGRCFTGARGQPKGPDITDLRKTARAAGESGRAAEAGMNARSACYARILLNEAERGQSYANKLPGGSHPFPWYHPDRSTGACSTAVQMFLSRSGFGHAKYVHVNEHSGDAINFWRRPHQRTGHLEEMGFVNEISKYNENNAPPGAILVYAGPLTDQFERNGTYPPKGSRGGYSAGDWVGHITVKGQPGRGFLTDGRMTHGAYSHRYLRGVFVMNHCKTCSQSIKRQCGDN